MGTSNFENLRIYQLSDYLADSIWEAVEKWNGFARDTIGKQISKA